VIRWICDDLMKFTLPWTQATRLQSRRDRLRYSSNLTDAEWALIEPFMPAARRIGRPRMTCRRAPGRGDPEPRFDRVPVAPIADGVPALFDRAGLFLYLATGRYVLADQPLSGLAPKKILLANGLERLRRGRRSGCKGLGPDLEGSHVAPPDRER
jgi:hypothetical protein